MAFRKILLASACITCIAGSATAADLVVEPVPVAPPAPAQASTWDGSFIGLHGGYGWGDATVSRNDGNFTDGYAIESGLDDWLGGVQVGYNFQYNNMVFGVIGDVSWTNMSGGAQSPYFAISGVAWETEYDYMATVRARAGWLVNNSALIYAHGGLAIADYETSFVSNGSLNGQSIGDTEVGWVIGAGVEAAVTNRISVFAEYSYMDFGNGGTSIASTTIPGLVWTSTIDPVNVVKVGLNFKLW